MFFTYYKNELWKDKNGPLFGLLKYAILGAENYTIILFLSENYSSFWFSRFVKC